MIPNFPSLPPSILLASWDTRAREYCMAWPLVIIPVILLWVASLVKILCEPTSPSNGSFLNIGGAERRNVLLVVAHPDDESMFFSPIINYLTSRGHIFHILCISTGNADGMGELRKEELHHASAILKVPLQRVKILDHPALQDGFGKIWDLDLLAELIEQVVITHDIDVIISFDSYGISGHCNHRDVHLGIRKLLLDCGLRNIEAWELVSRNIIRKYSGLMEVWLSKYFGAGGYHCLLNPHPRRSFVAMAQHRSQWIWFRKLFVIFSSYTYVNTIRRISV